MFLAREYKSHTNSGQVGTDLGYFFNFQAGERENFSDFFWRLIEGNIVLEPIVGNFHKKQVKIDLLKLLQEADVILVVDADIVNTIAK